jgi:hypothetical protein
MAKKKFYGEPEKQFHLFLRKLHERLVIILDDNVAKEVDPIEEDIILLQELYKMYNAPTTIPWIKEGADETVSVSQQPLFSDTTSEKQ